MATLLQINTTLNYGSTGRIAEQIGLTAREQGFECAIIHGPRMKNPSQLTAIQANSSFDEKIHGVWYSRLLDRHGLGSRRATEKLVRKIDSEIKPDIIHLHNIHGYYINYQVLFEYLHTVSTPVVWTLHDCWTFTGHCCYFDSVGCERWKESCYKCPLKHSYPQSLLCDRSAENYQLKKDLFSAISDRLTLVPVSEWLAQLVKQSFLKQCGIKTIHNGIDLQMYSPAVSKNLIEKYELAGKSIILGVAAPWSKRKGLDDFIRLHELLPSTQYAIVLIGLSDKQLADLPAGIIGIKRTQNVQELAQWYSAADVFVNPTYEDNYPTTNLEAMACGTPVITYRTGGSPEAVTPDTGLVVEKGDLAGLVAAIRTATSWNRDEIRQNCRKRAENHFDRQLCFQSYIDLYNNLIHKHDVHF